MGFRISSIYKNRRAREEGKAKAWETAIGLQDVDGLKPSKYLIDTAKEHIEGNINIEEVENRINKHYKVLDKKRRNRKYRRSRQSCCKNNRNTF